MARGRILLAVLFGLTGLPAKGQDTYRDWVVAEGPAGCVATITLGLGAPETGLLTLSLLPRQGGGEVPAVMGVRVPVGAALTEPLSYVHPGDDRAIALAWQTCDARTCLATGGVSAEELARLKAGRRIFVAFRPDPDSRALIVPVSLLGTTRAWGRVESCGQSGPD